ncbi:MAG: hypothetical protein COS35_10860 [Zetaproteobacteria bacterium CG02_land_8_20_14_3_00_50_9]|nr:MAG: hypothetical protein COW62_10485 [Zetaproteobacteria bacterium CG17_big_fil_post_rev_8_21_14_2_50_50_13]PIV29661.1 MAG: hypothetical protein COS35_10860 [Zetaproteobacteria bacterium CG02_land_8_20_14_3_00_50_9]
MSRTLLRIAMQREAIVAQAASQRGTLAHMIEPWRMPLSLADQGVTALRYLQRHPAGIVGAAVLLVAIRPGHMASWIGRGWVSWQLLQTLRSK